MIATEDQLDAVLTQPRPGLVDAARTWSSPLLILGAGGKMGPTLAVLARNAVDAAAHDCEIIAVSRFSRPAARDWLEDRGVRTLSADLLDREPWDHLPDATNLIYLLGQKFGTTNDPTQTWATNALLPVYACERYRGSRIAALSTGNVYPLTAADGPGSREGDPLDPPGEYANSAVARERLFAYFAQRDGTEVALLRLSYALDLRYGVVADLAQRVWDGGVIDVTTAWFNAIWQGDANEIVLRSLAHAATPAWACNVTGPRAAVADVARQLGELVGRQPRFVGEPSATAFLSDTMRMVDAFGAPATALDGVIAWTAAWVRSGGRMLGKPTHFETRGGRY